MGAEQARARTPFASPAGDSAIRRPRRSGCARLCALRARTARIRLRDGRGCWWRVSTQSASPHRSPVGRGRGRGCRITRLGRHTERVLSSCTLCDAVERRVGRVRGQKQRAQPYTRGTRGRVGGVPRCTPRGRGRRPRPVARSQTREDHIRRNGRRVAKLSATVRLGLHSLGVVEAGVSVNHTPQTRPPGRCAPRRRRRGERRARSGASASGSDSDSRSASRGGGSISI